MPESELADAAWLNDVGGRVELFGGQPDNEPGVLALKNGHLSFITADGTIIDEPIENVLLVDYTLNVFVMFGFADPGSAPEDVRVYKFGFGATRARDVPPDLLEQYGIGPSAGSASKPGLDSAKQTFRARKVGKRWKNEIPPERSQPEPDSQPASQ